MSQVLDAIKKIRTNKVGDALEKFADIVSKVESNNENVRQKGGGPGRGFYQYEMQAGSKKPQGAKTALNRYYNFLNQNNLTMPDSYARELKSKDFDPNDPDFTKLSRELQTEIFYADKQEDPNFKLADLANGALSYRDAWLKYHWKGPSKDREARIKHYNNEIPQPKPTLPLPEPRPERNMPPQTEPRLQQSFRFDESSTIDSFNSDPSITGGQAEDSLDAQMAEVMGSDPSRYRPVPKEKLTEGESLNSRELLESPTQQEVGPAYTEEELDREAYVDPESARRQQEFEEGTGAFAPESTGDQTIGDMLRSFFGTSEESDTYEGPTGEADPANFAEGGPVEKELEVTEDDLPDPPPGATPEEVADDIPAYLSTGEYVLPANVVRYYGLARIKDLHQNALFELQQMEDLGMIQNVDHNGKEEDDDDEMSFIQEPETLVVIESSKGLMRPMHFNGGGGTSGGDDPNENDDPSMDMSGTSTQSTGEDPNATDEQETSKNTPKDVQDPAAMPADPSFSQNLVENIAEDFVKGFTRVSVLEKMDEFGRALQGKARAAGISFDTPVDEETDVGFSGFGKGTDIGGDDGSRGGGGDDPNISMADLTPETPRITTSVRRFIPGVGIIDTAPKRGIMRAANGGMAYVPGVGLLGTGQKNTFGEDESDLFSFKDFVLTQSGTFGNMFIDAPEGYSPDEIKKWEEKTGQRYNKKPILTGKSLNQRKTFAREVTPFGLNVDGSAESNKEIAKDKELYEILSQYGIGGDQGELLKNYYEGSNVIDPSGSPSKNESLKAKLDTLASTRRIKRKGISSSDIPEGATNLDVIKSLYAPQVSLSESSGPENTFYPDNLTILSDPERFKRQYGSDLTGPADVDIVNNFIGASPDVSSPKSDKGIMSASPKGTFIPGVGLI